jgi:hypothetical protein
MGRKIVVRVEMLSVFFLLIGRVTANSPEVLRSTDVRNVLVSELKLKYEVLHVESLLRLKRKYYWLTWLKVWTCVRASQVFKP